MDLRPDPPAEPMIARDASYFKAPEALRERIRATIAAQAPARARSTPLRWAAVTAAFAVAGGLLWNAALLQTAADPEDALAGELVGAHVRSLLADSHLNDVASSDQHTVKPWFQGKLDFAPSVVDPAASGYTLLGGRLDYVRGRPVAAITYRRRLHVINVFEWPAAGAGEMEPVLQSRKGYALVRWRHGGLEHWAVSDAAAPEVLQLAQALKNP